MNPPAGHPPRIERRGPDRFVVEAQDLDRNPLEPETYDDLERARARVRELAGDEMIWRVYVRSEKNPLRVLYYYFSGDSQFHDLDRRRPVAEQFEPQNLPV